MQEPWLLHDFVEDFYGEELHLIIVGYIRPEVWLKLINLVCEISIAPRPVSSSFANVCVWKTGQFPITGEPDSKDS